MLSNLLFNNLNLMKKRLMNLIRKDHKHVQVERTKQIHDKVRNIIWIVMKIGNVNL